MPRRSEQRRIRSDVLRRNLAAARARSARGAVDRTNDPIFRRARDGGEQRGGSGVVRLAFPASVQGGDRNLVPFVPGLEARAASVAFRQPESQPGASRAGYWLSRFHTFQPFDPQVLWADAARDLFRLARPCDLSQRRACRRSRASIERASRTPSRFLGRRWGDDAAFTSSVDSRYPWRRRTP